MRERESGVVFQVQRTRGVFVVVNILLEEEPKRKRRTKREKKPLIRREGEKNFFC